MDNLRNKITTWFNSLSGTEKLILSVVSIIIISVLYFAFIKNSYRGTEINYKNLDSKTIIDNSYIVYDRDRIMSLDEIIQKLYKVHDGSFVLNGKQYTYRNMYNEVVNENYKKKLSYSKFKKLFNTMYNNTYDIYRQGSYSSVYTNIKNVYYSSTYDIYLVELEGITTSSFVGIRFVSDNSFLIAFME